MALEGTIKDFGLADILQLIGIQRKTGILTMDNGEDVVTVKFVDGQVVGADTRLRNLEDVLGAVLVRTGRVTEAQLRDALRQQRSTLQRLGYILVGGGAVSEDDLREALRIQVSQIVYRLFRWRDGRYHFDAIDNVDYDCEHFTPLSAESILMEGARMIDEWPIIERRIKSDRVVFRKTGAGQAIDVPVASLVDAYVDFGFDRSETSARDDSSRKVRVSAEELDLLRAVDGRSTVQEIVDRSPLGEFDVYRILYELLNRHLIEEVKVTRAQETQASAPTTARLVSIVLQMGVVALAALALSTSGMNPLAPWRVAGVRPDTDLVKTYASQARLERIEKAVETFYLDLGSFPGGLEPLVSAGYLRRADLLDPWGRSYAYRLSSGGFVVAGRDAGGEPTDGLRIEHAFSAAQRLLLDGAAIPTAE